MKYSTILGLFVITATQAASFGQSVVVPAADEFADANDQNRAPWSPAVFESISRYQDARGASDLTAMIGSEICSVAFRHDFGLFPGDEPSFDYTDVTITLSTGIGLVDNLSLNLDDNVGADATVVYSGPFSMPALEGDLDPNPFDLRVEFTTNFLYCGNDLLTEIRITGPTPPVFYLDSASTFGDTVSRALLYNGAPVVDTVGAVARIEYRGQASLEESRLGTPANPNALLPGVTSGPVLGATWDPVVDHTTFFPGAVSDVLVANPDGLQINVPSAIGTFLCNPPPGPGLIFLSPPGAPFTVAIPGDCGLVGHRACTQGASIDALGTARLTNALDITIGSF